MKPVFQEETISKLKEIIESTTSGSTDKIQVDQVADQIENSLKTYKDNQENKILYYGASIIILILSLILLYKTKSSWPLMFLVIGFAGFMYYRVHEKSLILENIFKSSKVEHDNPISKIDFLKSAIDLKVGRKNILKPFLSILISSSVMMGHFLFVDTSFWMNLGLLVGAIVVSFIFWNSFYKKDILELESMKNQLHQLENQIILGTSPPSGQN